VTLGSVTRPASTGTATTAQIKDLRRLTQSKTASGTFQTNLGGTQYPLVNVVFPAWGAYLNVPVDVPDWATHFSAVLTISGVRAEGATAGAMALVLGYQQTGQVVGTAVQYDENSGASAQNPQRFMNLCAVSGKLPASFLGTTRNLTFLANIFGGSAGLNLDGNTTVVVQYEFHVEAV
jgi:hypothetical protein